MDFLTWTSCALVPDRIPWGPGWYLVASNGRVEAGPFLTEQTATAAAWWIEDHCQGVHPAWEETDADGKERDDWPGAPYAVRHSRMGLLIGSRVRDRRAERDGLRPVG